MRPCGHDNPELSAPTCYPCRLYLRDPEYRRLWDGPAPATGGSCRPAQKRSLPCVHRGEDVRDESGQAVTRGLG